MRACRAAERRPGRECAAAGGGPARRGARDPHPVRVPGPVQIEPRLGPARREGAWPRRPAAVPAAWTHDRRLRLDQRHDLPARPPARLRRLGCGRRHRLVVRRGAPVLQARRGQRARRGRLPRRRRAARRLGESLDAAARRRHARGCRGGRVRTHPRPQRRPPGGGFPLPGQPAQWQALLDCRRVSAPGVGPAEPAGTHQRARAAHRLRGQPRGRCRGRPGREGRDRTRRA